MSRKHFSWLLGLTIAAAVVIGLLPERTGRESTFEVRPLLPGLADRINRIEEIQVVRGGSEPVATLRRSETQWTVEEAGGYPADWPKLRTLLAALAQTQIVEPKTANVAYFERLGLRDVSNPDSAAVQVRLGSAADAVRVLVGDAARNRDGQYVRLAGGERAFLVDRALEVSGQTRDWLDRDIVDVAESEVVEVKVVHPDGETVHLKKTSADDADFVLQNLPEGREAQSSWTVNAPGGGLAGLSLDAVRPADAVPFETPVRYELLTADGLHITAELTASDEKHWIRLEASAHETKARGTVEPKPGVEELPDPDSAAVSKPEAETNAEPEEGAVAPSRGTDPEARAAQINERVLGWAYAIPQYKYEVLTKRLEDLLKPLPEPED